MKLFGSKPRDSESMALLKRCIQEDPSNQWARTPNLFFSHVKSVAEFFYVYQQVPALKENLELYVEESLETFFKWKITAENFLEFLRIVPNKISFIEKYFGMRHHPHFAAMFDKPDTIRMLMCSVLALDNSTESKVRYDFFVLFIEFYITQMPLQDTQELLKIISLALFKKWFLEPPLMKLAQDHWGHFMSVWPMFVEHVGMSEALEALRIMKNKKDLSQLCAPILLKCDEQAFAKLYAEFVLGPDKQLAKYFSNLFNEKLMQLQQPSPAYSQIFHDFYLAANGAFPHCTWQQHLKYIKVFPEHAEILLNALLLETRFHHYKVSVPMLEQGVVSLGPRGAGVLALILRKIKSFKTPPFTVNELDQIALFAGNLVGPHDAELAFCLLEFYWDAVKWLIPKQTQVQFIGRCSEESCNEYAIQKDEQSLASLTRYLLNSSIDLFALLISRISRKTISIVVRMNEPEVNAFLKTKTGRQQLVTIMQKLDTQAFTAFITFFGVPFVFSMSCLPMRNRFCEILLDAKFIFVPASNFHEYLSANADELFAAIMKIDGMNLLFLRRLQTDLILKDIFAKPLKDIRLDSEIKERQLQMQFLDTPLTFGLIRSALLSWFDQPKLNDGFFLFGRRLVSQETPEFIKNLQQLMQNSLRRKARSRDVVDEDEHIALKVLLRDWQQTKNQYSQSVQNSVDKIVRLLQSTSTFRIPTRLVNENSNLEFKDSTTYLQDMATALDNTLPQTHQAFRDAKKVIDVMRYIVDNLPKLQYFFKHEYGRLYLNAPHDIPIHTDHAVRGDVDGFKRALQLFILNFLHAYTFAQKNGLLKEFFQTLYGGYCIEGRVGPCIVWAGLQVDSRAVVKLDDFMAKATNEHRAFAVCVQGLEDNDPKLENPNLVADFIMQRYGKLHCEPHKLAPNNLITHKVIYHFCVETLSMVDETKETGLIKMISSRWH